MKKLATYIEVFFKYSYKGNGKYYTTDQGSQSYKNTDFQSFASRNEDCIEIIERGNDAPRGGRTGEYVIVEFTPFFTEKYGWWFEQNENEKQRAAERQSKLQAEIDALGNQTELLNAYFTNNTDFLAKIKDRIENYPSKQWRNWVRMKVCSKIANERFDLLTLCATDIREIAYSL